MPIARQIPAAMATPVHTHRNASRRPCAPRNAAMIPTISAASTPSRRPMTKVGSISSPVPVAGGMRAIACPLGNPNNGGPVKSLPMTAARMTPSVRRSDRSFVAVCLAAVVTIAACSGSTSSGSAAGGGSERTGSRSSATSGPSITVAAGQCWSAAVAPLSATGGASGFEDITDGAGLTTPLLGMMGHAVAMGDVNGDGLVDLFVGGFADRPADEYAVRGADGAAPDRVLLGGPNGFTVDDGFPGTLGRTSSAAIVDLNNDGRPDIVAGRNNGKRGKKQEQSDVQAAPTTIYRNDGDGRFSDVGEVGPEFARAVTALDVDNDGRLDLFIGQDRKDGAPQLLHNDGDFAFSDITAARGLPSPMIVYGATAADLNDDGRPDLAIAGEQSPGVAGDRIFIATDDGKFREATPSNFVWETFGAEDLVTGIAVGDLDRDGRPDLVVGHHYGSTIDDGKRVPIRIFLNRGNDDSGAPNWDDVTAKAGVPGFATKSPHVEIQDFDNDGRADVLVTASAGNGGTPVILRNNGVDGDTPTFTASDGLGDPQYWVSGGVADVDHDGRLDVFVVEFDATKPSKLFRTTGPSGHWLGVDVGNTPMSGVGSLVQVFKPGAERDAGGLIGSGWVTASTGYGAGAAPIVHIGLGDIPTVEVVVRAPNGETTTMEGGAADKMVRPGGWG